MITALLIALMIFSAVVYVTEVMKQIPLIDANNYDVFPQYQQALRNTAISALSNVTNNGSSQVLHQDIDELNQLFSSHYYESMIQINYSLTNTAPFQNGFWISRQQSHTIVGAQVSYWLNSVGNTKMSSNSGLVNVSSEAFLSGTCKQFNETTKQGKITIRVLNDGVPALANALTCYYQNDTELIMTETSNVTDLGNGVYEIEFLAQLSQPSDPLIVLVNVLDHRDINVSVTTTCTVL